MMKKWSKFVSLVIAAIMLLAVAGCTDKNPPESDADYLIRALGTLSVSAQTSANLTLPELNATDFPDVTLTWATDKPEAITNAGVVTRSLEDVTVKLTVTAAKTGSDVTKSKDFNVKVLKRELNDAEKLAAAKAGLSITATASTNFDLPDTAGGAAVAWSVKSGGSFVTVAGGVAQVTRPEYGQQNAAVVLTATLTIGSESDTKDFNVSILSKGLVDVPVTKGTIDYALETDDGKVMLLISGSAYMDATIAARKYFLQISSNANTAVAKTEGVNTEGTEFEFKIDVTDIAAGTWWDVLMYVEETPAGGTAVEKRFEITAAKQFDESRQKIDNYVYRFIGHDDSGVFYLKVHKFADAVVSGRTNDNTYFSEEGTTVYLNITGSAYFEDSGTKARAITLTLKNMNGGNAYANQRPGTDADTRNFLFKIDVTNTPMEGTNNDSGWLDIKLQVAEGGISYDGDLKQGAMLFNVPSANAFGGTGGDTHKFFFKEWNQDLKYVSEKSATRPVVFSSHSSDTVYFAKGTGAEDNKVFLFIEGYAYANANATVRTHSVYVREHTLTLADNTNIYEGQQLGGYKFKIDVTGKVCGGWDLISMKIVEDGTEYPMNKIGPSNENIAKFSSMTVGEKEYFVWAEWNELFLNTGNISASLSVTDKTSAALTKEGDKIYFNLSGTAYVFDSNADRTIKLKITNDDGSLEINNSYTGADKTAYVFKEDITNYAVGKGWHKFKLIIIENGVTLEYDLNLAKDAGGTGNNFESDHKDDWKQIGEAFNISGVKYELCYNWSTLYFQIAT